MYRPDWFIEEERNLVNAYFNDENYKKNMFAYIVEHASNRWLKYRDKIKKEYKDNLKKGVIID